MEFASVDLASARSKLQMADHDARDKPEQSIRLAQDAQQHARRTDRGMMLMLGNVLFATGGDTLNPGADELVSRLSQFLQNHPDIKVRIDGHTDGIGTDSYNEALSRRCAEALAPDAHGQFMSGWNGAPALAAGPFQAP